MTRLRALFILLLAIAVIAGGWWWRVLEAPSSAISPGVEPSRAAGGSEPGSQEGATVSGGGAAEGERSPGALTGALLVGPRVRSATGLALEQLELTRAGSPWKSAQLAEDRLLVPEGDGLQRVRARGHLATPVEAGDEVVELQPVASLLLRGPDARSRIQAVALGFGRDGAALAQLERVALSGFRDEDTWVLALDPGEEWGELNVRFELSDGSELWIDARPTRGARIEVPLPPEQLPAERLPFEVEVRGASSPVQLSIDAKVRLDRGRVRSEDGAELASWRHLRDALSLALESNDGRFTLPGFERGRSFYLRAQAPAEGSEVGHSFTSDGERIVLELSGGRVLRGRLVTDGAPLPGQVDLSWSYSRADGLQAKGIVAEATVLQGVPIDEAGRFEVGVRDEWLWEGMTLAPDRLLVTFDVAGFEGLQVEVELSAGERVYELGTLLLSSRTPELVLRGAVPAGGRHGESSVLCSPRAPLVRHYVDCLLEGELGGAPVTEVYLQKLLNEAGEARYEFGRLRYSWGGLEDFAPSELVLLVEGQALPFERAADGTYSPVEPVARPVELELAALPEGATRLELAWSWRGLVVPLHVDGTQVLTTLEQGDVLTLELAVPAEGVELLAQFSKRRANDGAAMLLGERYRRQLVDGRLRLQLP